MDRRLFDDPLMMDGFLAAGVCSASGAIALTLFAKRTGMRITLLAGRAVSTEGRVA